MRFFTAITLFFAFALIFSCERLPIINCSECTGQEPLNTDIKIKVGIGIKTTVINVYEGDLEDNVLYRTFITNLITETSVNVPINKRYTITATYELSSGTYTAVDSAFPRVKYDEQQCENPCYYVYDNIVNLRLKYQ